MTLSTVKPSVDSRALPPHSQIPLPITWQPVVEAHLKTEEKVLAWLEIDLNARLRFAKGLVVLTSQRLLARQTPTPHQADISVPMSSSLR